MHTWTQVIVPPWTSSWCQVSPEHPWVADALLGSGEVLASGCAEQPLRAWGCPIWACGFLATVGTAALLAGGEGGHLCALCMKAAFALGGMLLRLPQQHCPVQSHKCFLPHMLSRILRKQWRGNNKRHWLVSRLRRYSELAQISKAGVIHSAHHSNTVMFEIQGGEILALLHSWELSPVRSVQFSSLMFSVWWKSISSASETNFFEARE